MEFDGNVMANYPLQILLAEDNIINQKLTVKMLEKMGYSTDIAVNGIEVLGLVKSKSYDLILMDIRMPEMDGIQATRELIHIYGENRPVIIAITADVINGAEEKYLAEGLDDYMAKPLYQDEFQAMVLKWAIQINQKVFVPVN